MTLARSLVLAGEVDEGAAEAVGNLTVLEEVESGRVTNRLTEVRDLLAGVDAASAREASERLTDYVLRHREEA
ncbi:hypothetical protein [Streptomyces odontomachi]|uniref:hypothetical protein n=1 Tax=Streptomyces odontomachi TaxID=2944940 RepID=UPI00210A122B|nr:hypothetical protein [Streptomyces sp. ODS25]